MTCYVIIFKKDCATKKLTVLLDGVFFTFCINLFKHDARYRDYIMAISNAEAFLEHLDSTEVGMWAEHFRK